MRAAVCVMVAMVVVVALASGVRAVDNPVIGILGKPESDAPDARSWFVDFYVHWLEQAGARVVPIPHQLSQNATALHSLLGSLNGVLFTGGENPLALHSDYVNTARAFLEYSMRMYSQGEIFPVWGTCMGFQLIHVLLANTDEVLTSGYASWDVSYPLTLLPAADNSTFFSSLMTQTVHDLSTLPITLNFHKSGVEPSAYSKYPVLAQTLKVLSTNTDDNGRPFVSTVEGIDYPILASQWHTERPQFEYNNYDVGIDHSRASRYAMFDVANMFTDQCRRSTQSFPSWDALNAATIYRLNATYGGFSTRTYYF